MPMASKSKKIIGCPPPRSKVEGVDFFVNAKGESTEVGDLVAIDPYPPNQWLARVEGLCVVDGQAGPETGGGAP